jgi:hypothetical protein
MKTQRKIIFIGGLMLALAVAWPAPSFASSLLSGYGGPGQGNQAILGSALVNGSRGGGGGTGGGGTGGSGGSSSSSSGSERSAAGEGGSSSGSSAPGTGSGKPSTSSGKSGSGSSTRGSDSGSGARSSGTGHGDAGTTRSTTASFYPASERVPAGEDSGTLGLSGADLIYIILAIGTLLFMGVLTTRLGRSSTTASSGG